MRSFMDEVSWLIRPGGGTTVRMLKRRYSQMHKGDLKWLS